MARSHRNRPALTIESLEKREVLTAGGPTEQAQYMLEVLNLARTNPAEAADWVRDNADSTIQANLNYYGINLNDVTAQIASAKTQQPLAWDDQLAAAAAQQATDMATNGFQSHDGSTAATRTVENRLDNAGYGNRVSYGENGFAYTRGTGEKAVVNSMQAFLVDWGVAGSPHRKNIQQPDSTSANSAAEVGVSITPVTRTDLLAKGFGPTVVTQVLGRQAGAKAQIVGVAYQDADHNGRFSYQEGRGDVSIDITNTATGATQSLRTWDAGGYQTEVDPGTYTVSARSGSKSLGSKTVRVGSENVKVDFNVDNVVAEPAPAPTPAPAPVVKIATPAVTTTSTTPAPTTVKLSSASISSGLNAPAIRVVSTPVVEATPTLASDTGRTSAAVNFSAADEAPVAAAQIVSAPSTEAARTAAIDDVVSTGGLLKNFLTSKVSWGQGWKASS
jgi:uncharacterized protein YkwD